jgi:hypothetical protein
MPGFIRSLCTVLALMMLAGSAAAQSATITANATVLQPLTVTNARNLDFGNVYPGINKAIAHTAATSGKFSVSGVASAQVNISFTLPTDLSSGGNTLPIGTWTGCHNTVDATAGCTTFTPSTSNTTTNLAAVTGALYVFVGGTVSPGGTQAQGSYTANVTMTAAYTGL